MNKIHREITSHDGIVKSISTKPLTVTLRDSLYISMVSVIVLLIITFIYNQFSTEDKKLTFADVAINTVLATVAAQFVYEYSGLNNIVAESSMRYSKGSTLDKYVSRRDALIYQLYYQIKEAIQSGKMVDVPNLDSRFTLLKFILSHPNTAASIADGKPVESVIRLLSADNIQTVQALYALPQPVKESLGVLSDRANKFTICDILVNSFDEYTPDKKFIVFNTITDVDRLESRGEAIYNMLNNNEDNDKI
jgi:hypothetical protein